MHQHYCRPVPASRQVCDEFANAFRYLSWLERLQQLQLFSKTQLKAGAHGSILVVAPPAEFMPHLEAVKRETKVEVSTVRAGRRG